MKYIHILAVLFSVGCQRLHEGAVVEKWYEPEREYHYTTIIMAGKVPVIMHYTGIDDEDYVIRIRGVYKGDTITEKFYINKPEWECLYYGSWFNDSIPCSRNDEGEGRE